MNDRPLMLDGLDGYQFEELIAKIMKKRGYEKIRVTSKSRDVGKDIIMEDKEEGALILVECKHQDFVGRPVIQKLQGAIDHEEKKNPNKKVKGMIVTSGKFSKEAVQYNKEIGQDIELIDGKKLRVLTRELDVVVLNGKVQIITNNTFKDINEEEAEGVTRRCFHHIRGSNKHNLLITSEENFHPACYIEYDINFDTCTSVGCIDKYSNEGVLVIDGVSGNPIVSDLSSFFFSSRVVLDRIEETKSKNKILFEFTENDIEDYAFNYLIKLHTHHVSYIGNNRVTYTKSCIPNKRDIDIQQFLPIYLPFWRNIIRVSKQNYKQEFYVNGDKQFFINDEFKICKICKRQEEEYEKMSICPECSRIVCKAHTKIDYLDKETPICEEHAKPFKLWLQTKYFAKQTNLEEYEKWWTSQNYFGKLYEDKIVLGLAISGLVIFFFILVQNL